MSERTLVDKEPLLETILNTINLFALWTPRKTVDDRLQA
jgi:hypothetical protein